MRTTRGYALRKYTATISTTENFRLTAEDTQIAFATDDLTDCLEGIVEGVDDVFYEDGTFTATLVFRCNYESSSHLGTREEPGDVDVDYDADLNTSDISAVENLGFVDRISNLTEENDVEFYEEESPRYDDIYMGDW